MSQQAVKGTATSTPCHARSQVLCRSQSWWINWSSLQSLKSCEYLYNSTLSFCEGHRLHDKTRVCKHSVTGSCARVCRGKLPTNMPSLLQPPAIFVSVVHLSRSFTDIAFVDFQDPRRDWATNGIISAEDYKQVLGRQPQSLNDFKYSCDRLAVAGQLPMNYTTCEAKRRAFGSSLKVIRWAELCWP